MNDNKTIKVLRIITLTLTMLLLVFALAKKVGICAASEQISVPREIPFTPMFQYSPLANDFDAQVNLVSDLNTFFGLGDYVLMFDNVNDATSIKVYARGSGPFGLYGFSSWVNGNSSSIGYVGTPYTGHINADGTLDGSLTVSPYGNGFYYESAGDTDVIYITIGSVNPFIPVYSPSIVYDVNDMGQEGNNSMLSIGLYDDNGEIDFDALQSLVDSTGEFADNMSGFISDLPVDNGNNTVSQWLSNIFNLLGGGFSGLFNNIFTFFKPYLDSFIEFWGSLIDIITSIPSVLNDIKSILQGNGDEQSIIYSAWINGYNNSVFADIATLASNCKNILWQIVNTPAASSVVYTINTVPVNVPNANTGAANNVYLFGQTWTLDFSWYRTASIMGKTIYEWVNSTFFTFLYVGFLAALFFKLPSIIGGASGFSHTIHGSYTDSVGHSSDNAGSTSSSQYDFKALEKMIREG